MMLPSGARQAPIGAAAGRRMAYFVTGATGFIGRHLVQRLLDRDGDLYLLVRETSTGRLEAAIDKWGPAAAGRIHAVVGDLASPRLGVSDDTLEELRQASIDHFFH